MNANFYTFDPAGHSRRGPETSSNGAGFGLDSVGQMELRRGLLLMAMRDVPTAALGSLVVAAVTAVVVWAGAPRGPLVAWLCAMAAVCVTRMWLGAATKRMIAHAGLEALSRRVAAIGLLAEFNGLLWGVLVPMLIPHDNLGLRTVASCIVVAMAATAVGSYSALPAAGQRFLFAALVPLGVSSLIHVTGRAGVIEFVICVIVLGLIWTTLRSAATKVTDSLVARLRDEQMGSGMEIAIPATHFGTFRRPV